MFSVSIPRKHHRLSNYNHFGQQRNSMPHRTNKNKQRICIWHLHRRHNTRTNPSTKQVTKTLQIKSNQANTNTDDKQLVNVVSKQIYYNNYLNNREKREATAKIHREPVCVIYQLL